jgi:uncharacterized protein (TIGR03435 family)
MPLPSVRCFALALIVLACTLPYLSAQAAPQISKAKIAAASVRWLCRDQACRKFPSGLQIDPLHYSCNNCELWQLILAAYGVRIPSQFERAEAWFGDDYYQVEIAADEPVQRIQMQTVLLREVLTRCFGLKVSQVAKKVPGYALTVASGGIKFSASKSGTSPAPFRVVDGIQHFSSVGQFVAFLNQYYYLGKRLGVTRPVHDATGLSGSVDIPFPLPSPSANLLAGVKALGLTLEPSPGTERKFEIQHVDHLRASCTVGPSKG